MGRGRQCRLVDGAWAARLTQSQHRLALSVRAETDVGMLGELDAPIDYGSALPSTAGPPPLPHPITHLFHRVEGGLGAARQHHPPVPKNERQQAGGWGVGDAVHAAGLQGLGRSSHELGMAV